jgi:hypothetical protein
MKIVFMVFSCVLATPAHADWYYYVMKVVCDRSEIKIINYSAYNEIGEARGKESDAIDVDKLSTWKHTSDDLNVPDKPKPYVKVCKIPAGKYRVTLTNAGGGYSAPYPVVNVVEISNPKVPTPLIADLALDNAVKNRYEIVFSTQHPKGQIIDE